MELNEPLMKLKELISKYRYALLILVVGILLMLLPSGGEKEILPVETVSQETSLPTTEEKLGNILCKIQGAGKVEVILSFASGSETLYHEDRDTDGGRFDTVIVTDAQRNQSALVKRVDPPTYLGAVVVCQGADSAAVRLAIVDAVSKFTGLGADQISVLKMK